MRVKKPEEIDADPSEIKGEGANATFSRCHQIMKKHFQENLSESPLKGFLFYGKPGTGKTFTAKALAKQTNATLYFVDGADVSQGIYGESEKTIRRTFEKAQEGEEKAVILFDDVESIFMKREEDMTEEWHFAQNSVFFHEVDELDPSETFVILTTNRFDLIDDAIVDRFHSIEFPEPTPEVLKEIVDSKCESYLRNPNFTEENVENIKRRVDEEEFTTMRKVEKAIMEEYIQTI